ncbi:thermonuclease family protein [Zavarzinia sp. CC-PAN008]|uniref:thermonuclease family protein n=1 Tax=Zavarzinia sp. CC-PAN008 TaxID=3243332 RepID=UPI003F748558
MPVHDLAAEIRVIDGDTIDLGGERIRLLGIDTPELRARCPQELDRARAARRRVVDLVAQCGVGGVERAGRDRAGRTLAHVTVCGRDLGTILLDEGYARAWIRGRRIDWCGSH